MSVCKIYSNGSVVGKATIKREGLYYRIECVCDLPEDGIFRVSAVTTKEGVNLGVCVPENGQQCLLTRVPVRRLGEEIPQFHIVGKESGTPYSFELTPGGTFEHIRDLRDCYYFCNDGKHYLVKKTGQQQNQ